jgi:hypothetical protein
MVASEDHTTAHLSDDDLERYCLGMVQHRDEVDLLDEHLLVCAQCISRAEAAQTRIRAFRNAIVESGFHRE